MKSSQYLLPLLFSPILFAAPINAQSAPNPGTLPKSNFCFSRLFRPLPIVIPYSSSYGYDALAEIATQYAVTQQYDLAMEIAETISSPSIKAKIFIKIAHELVQAKMNHRSLLILHRSIDIVRNIKEKYSQTYLLSKIALGYATVGKLQEVYQVIDLIKEPIYKSQVLTSVVEYYIANRQYELVDQLINDLKEDQYSKIHEIILADLVLQSIKDSQPNKAWEIINHINDECKRDSILNDVADQLLRNQNLDEAFIIAKSMYYQENRAALLVNISAQYVAQSRDKALEILLQVEEAVMALPNSENKATLMAKLAGQYYQIGQADRAVTILSQALNSRKKSTSLPTINLPIETMKVNNNIVTFPDANKYLACNQTAKNESQGAEQDRCWRILGQQQ